MKPRIVIALWGNNLFFLQGIRCIFEKYFYAQGMTALFLPTAGMSVVDLNVADLIVKSNADWKEGRQQRHKILLIREKNAERIIYQQGEIGSDAKPEAVMLLLDRLFEAPLKNSAHSLSDYVKITLREREVLRAIAAGLSPTQIAKRLQISTKTVSAHKQASMRKLGFQRSRDLYHWLWQGSPNIANIPVGTRVVLREAQADTLG